MSTVLAVFNTVQVIAIQRVNLSSDEMYDTLHIGCSRTWLVYAVHRTLLSLQK